MLIAPSCPECFTPMEADLAHRRWVCDRPHGYKGPITVDVEDDYPVPVAGDFDMDGRLDTVSNGIHDIDDVIAQLWYGLDARVLRWRLNDPQAGPVEPRVAVDWASLPSYTIIAIFKL